MNYSQIFRFRVSEEMNEMVREEAERLNMKISDYLRWLIRKELGFKKEDQKSSRTTWENPSYKKWKIKN